MRLLAVLAVDGVPRVAGVCAAIGVPVVPTGACKFPVVCISAVLIFLLVLTSLPAVAGVLFAAVVAEFAVANLLTVTSFPGVADDIWRTC
jgi:hypothetical protein